MKTLAAHTSLSAALTLLLLSACGGGSGDSDTASSAPPTAHNSHGLMQLTVNGLGSAALQAQAASIHAGPQARVAGLGNDSGALNGLDVQQVSASTVDVGTRGAGGMRYINVVLQVRNAQSCDTPGTCAPYTTASQNLSFVAANVAASLDGTAVTAIYREDGSTDSTEQALATQMLPIDGMLASNPAGGVVPAAGQESLQVFTEAEIIGSFVDPDANYLFPYGYVVENINTPGSRALPANPANNQWDGQLTFAFKVPLQASLKNDPYSVSFMFDVLDDSNTRVTESAEEQTTTGDVLFNQLAATLGSTDLAVLGGRIAQTNIGDPICTVRTAGPAAAPVAYLANNGNTPTLASAPSNLILAPAGSVNFGFCAPMDAATATAATMVLNGSETGAHAGSYNGGSNRISFASTKPFAAGETVSYSLTTGLQSGTGTALTQAVVGSFMVGGSVPSSGTFPSGPGNYTVGTGSTAVAVGDFNGDGKLDLVTASTIQSTISIVLGKGDGTFGPAVSYGAEAGPRAVAVGDFNGDGKLDLVVANSNGGATVSIRLGNGDGTFQSAVDYGAGPYPYAVAVGDFNGDGKLDLAVADAVSNTVAILLGNGDGSFATAVNYVSGSAPQGVAVGDFDGDGKLDLVVANNSDNTVAILLGNGDGTFRNAVPYGTGGGPISVVVGDFNGDGKPDFVVANNNDSTLSVMLGKGDGSFAAAGTYGVKTLPQGLSVGDFNGDGKLDLAEANAFTAAVGILFGHGDGTFAAPVYTGGFAHPACTATGDFNGDGRLDLATSNAASSVVSVLLGQP